MRSFNPIGFWTLLQRESLRFLTLPNQTIVPPMVSAALFVIVFGYFLGNRVQPIEGFDYVVFIFPGLIMMGVTSSAFQNTMSSLFISRWERFIDDLLVAPISYAEMVLAYLLSSVLRGLVTAVAIMLAGFLLVPTPLHHPWLLLWALVAASTAFAAVGLIVGLWAERWDNLAVFQNYVMTPLVFLGGVFYSTSALPVNFRWVNQANPIYYMVTAVRYAFLGQAEVPYATCMGITGVFSGLVIVWAVYLFRIGYKLRT